MEANQNWTDDGTHPPGTLCSLEEIGPVNKFIIIWLCQPKAGCTSKALTNPINSLAPTEIMSYLNVPERTWPPFRVISNLIRDISIYTLGYLWIKLL